MQINTTHKKASYYTVYGVLTHFRLPGSPYVVRYASTYINPAEEGGHHQLMNALHPMREHVRASELTSLRSLLQRDLNDARVANELIPYLQGRRGKIGFFPAVLALLIPKGFLKDRGATIEYPNPEERDEVRHYGAYWRVSSFKDKNGSPLPFGEVQINDIDTSVVVLDGQHRVSAFRYLHNPGLLKGKPHKVFYENLGGKGTELNASLPVTLIWFETDDPTNDVIEPREISRRLFVDVNNSAKKVSESRQLLLDDRALRAISTQEFYGRCARNGFSPREMSLLHGAFDMDSDLSQRSWPQVTLTTPEIVASAFNWALFGTKEFDSLARFAIKKLHVQSNTQRFRSTTGVDAARDWVIQKALAEHDTELSGPTVVEGMEDALRTLLRETVVPQFEALFTEFEFLQPHFLACEDVSRWAKPKADSDIQEGDSSTQHETAWDDVLCGGEGLYWSLKPRRANQHGSSLWRATREVLKKFREYRAERMGHSAILVDRAYESFTTKAFQVAFMMCVQVINDEKYLDAILDDDMSDLTTPERLAKTAHWLIERMNALDYGNWIAIFGVIRQSLIPNDATPKAWPTYRNILLAVADPAGKVIYTRRKVEVSPAWKALENRWVRRAADTVDRADVPSSKRLNQLVREDIAEVGSLFAQANILPGWLAVDDEDLVRMASNTLKNLYDTALEKAKKDRPSEG